MPTIDEDHRRDARPDWRDTQEPWRQTQDKKEILVMQNTKNNRDPREVEPTPPRPDKPRFRKYKHEDNVILRKNIEITLAKAIEDMLGGKILYKVLSSSITHTDLLPEGDTFSINFVIEVHEKKVPPGQE